MHQTLWEPHRKMQRERNREDLLKVHECMVGFVGGDEGEERVAKSEGPLNT